MNNLRDNKKIIDVVSVYRSVIILVIICLVSTLLSDKFLSLTNFFNVIRQVTVAGIIACGMTFVILTGGIDLSVGSIVGFSGVVSAGTLASTGNVFLSIAVALVIGLACGAVNGILVAKFEIPAFIATLGMMILLRGCVLVYTNGKPIPARNDVFNFIGKGDIFGVPFPIILLIIIYIIAYFILEKTIFGRNVYSIGGNREATALSGIDVVKNEFMVYVINGLLSATAAVVLISRLGSAQSTSGEGIEMDAIAAVILGGTSLSGGTGYVLPTVIGAIIMGIIDNILTLLNVDPHATNIVKGAVILVAVLVDKKVKDLSEQAK